MQYEVKLMLKKMIEIDKYFSHGKQIWKQWTKYTKLLQFYRLFQYKVDQHWAWVYWS